MEETHCTYEDFAKLTIRIGTIQAVTPVPETDKLLQLTVDFGDETRSIVSGIRHLVPDFANLVGQQAPFVTNLAPRRIKGVESQGMILAVGEDDTFRLLHPHAPVTAGTAVH